jgi:hypothetical protein
MPDSIDLLIFLHLQGRILYEIASIERLSGYKEEKLVGEEVTDSDYFRPEKPVHIDNVLMNREFDTQHALEMISQRGLSYVVAKQMKISEKAQAKRLLLNQDHCGIDRKLSLGDF